MLDSGANLFAFGGEGAFGTAGLLAVAGALAQAASRRLPRGLGTSLFAVGVTLALAIVWKENDWQPQILIYRFALIAAVLGAAWTLLAVLAAPRGEEPLSGMESAIEPDTSQADPASSAMRARDDHVLAIGETFSAWAAIMIVTAGAILGYVLLIATVQRLTTAHVPLDGVPSIGLLVLALVGAALLVSAARGHSPHAPVMLLATAGLASWWTSLMIPSASISGDVPQTLRLPFQPAWWTWSFHLMFSLSLTLVVAAVVQESGYRRRRARAWPNRLDDLLAPYSRWPGYVQVEAVFAACILLLGVYQIIRGGQAGWQLPLMTCLMAGAAGYTCLYMTYRRWSGNTAGLGMALFTLAIVALTCSIASPFYGPHQYVEYVDRMPILFNAVLIALWICIALWSWLSGFWEQQLLDGRPWTTAGAMIPGASRTAFMLTAVATLIAFQMTRWPLQAMATNRDDSWARIVIGGLTIALLMLQAARVARRSASVPHAAMATTLALACAAFVFVRLPASSARGWLMQHYSVVFAALAIPMLLAAEALDRRPQAKGRVFAAPLWLLALLALPAAAMSALLPHTRPASQWLQPATLAVLVVLFFLAGLREHRRAFLVLSAVLLVACVTTLAPG